MLAIHKRLSRRRVQVGARKKSRALGIPHIMQSDKGAEEAGVFWYGVSKLWAGGRRRLGA